MLFIFALSATPKLYLHDLFANHADMEINSNSSGKVIISKPGFSCDNNSLVATSPFIDDSTEVVFLCVQAYQTSPVPVTTQLYTSGIYAADLRGPPVASL